MSKPGHGDSLGRTASRVLGVLFALLIAVLGGPGAGALELVVQPGEGRDPRALRALAERISAAIGEPVDTKVRASALAHWRALRVDDGMPRLVLEEAHFADWRVKRHGYRILAGVEGTVSEALVTRPGVVFLAPEDLAGKRVAGPAPPALAAVLLQALLGDSLRAPVMVEASEPEAAAALVLRGEVAAALLPPAVARLHPELRVVLLTEETPGMALSASRALDAGVAAAAARAVLAAPGETSGARTLARAGLGPFRSASDELYAGYARLLRDVWGY